MRPLLLLACVLPGIAAASPAVSISRTVPATLAKAPTTETTVDLLTGARWRYLIPDKRTSTWESKTLTFDAAGTVDVMTMMAWGPETKTLPWKLVKPAVVEIAKKRYTLRACTDVKPTVCLLGPLP